MYAFGSIKFTLIPKPNQKYIRQSLKDQLHNMMNKKRLGENPIEQRMLIKQDKEGKKKMEIIIYGDNLMPAFK